MQIVTIRIKGEMDESWSECFEGFEFFHCGASDTLLTGLVEDQAAFYGLIGKLRDLGLQLMEVSSVEHPEPIEPGEE
jgi:hypothetical protein